MHSQTQPPATEPTARTHRASRNRSTLGHIRQRIAAVVCCTVAAFAHAQDPIPGSLDAAPFPGFASGTGKIPALAIGTSTDTATAVALQPDGKMVLAGYCSNGSSNNFCVARLNADGSLDTSFDGPPGTYGNGKFLLPIGTGNDVATAVALQPDGKIVLAGSCYNGSDNDFCVARLNADGSLDASFDGPSGSGDGKFLLPIGTGTDRANAVALQPDGKMVLAGYCNGSNNDFCVARLNADGTLDTSFDGPSGSGNGKFLLPIGSSDDVAHAIALQPDGKIVLAGYCSNGTNHDFCVARLNADGSLDSSFDGPSGTGDGQFLLPIGSSADYATAIALQPDGKIVLAGGCSNGSNNDFCVARLNADGSLDTGFDGPTGTGNGKFLLPNGTSQDFANAIALQPDGKIVLAGKCSNGSNDDFCVARLNADGSLDTGFDGPTGTGNGKFLLPIGTSTDTANAIALQPDGKIVLAGGCNNGTNYDFCVARVHGGPFGAKQCSPDYDGDGQVLATTDALIFTRVALGLTDNAVVGGITFAAHATRSTWPDIRSFLVVHCGLRIP